MKKFFSLLTALLFVGSMWAVDGAIASAIEAGDQVVLINTGGTKELTGVSGNVGTATDYTETPNGTLILTVEAGLSGSGFSFKLSDGSYLAYTSTGNNLNTLTITSGSTATQKKQASWTVSISGSKEATITNVNTTGRVLKYNSGSPRFCCYTSGQQLVKLFKLATSSVAMPTITPSKGSFQGSVEVTLACATDGASIYYTTDASKKDAPSTSTWTAYSGAAKPSFNTTTTIYVAANKGTDWSNVATKTFTLYPTEMTCAAARTAAQSVSGNNVPYADSLIFTVQGYVTNIQSEWAEGTISFWIADAANGGKVIEAFKATCANEADAPVVGELVAVTGSLTKFNGTPEFAAGCTFTIIPQPYITPAPTSLDFKAVEKGSAEPAKTFTLNGNNLTDANDITVTAPTGFKVSVGDDDPANSITLNSASGALSATIKVTPVTSTNGVFEGNVTIATDDLDDEVTVAVAMTVTERFTVSFSTGEGNPTVDAKTETVVAAGITLPAGVAPQCTDWTFAGWAETAVAEATTTAPTLLKADDNYKPTANVTLYAVYSQTEGASEHYGTVTVTYNSTNFPDAYAALAEYTLEGYKFKIQQIYKNGEKMQWRAAGNSNGTGLIYNTQAFPTKISSIILTYDASDSNKNHTLKVGDAENPTEGTAITGVTDGLVETFDCSAKNADYFLLENGANAGYTASIAIKYGNAGTTTYISEPTCTGTALDNTASDTKAVKTIVNGQLIIEKAGVKYNVLGQSIR